MTYYEYNGNLVDFQQARRQGYTLDLYKNGLID